MKRRAFVGTAAATAAGLWLTQGVASASLELEEFTALDDQILTTDGTVTSVVVQPTVVVGWAGLDGGGELTLSLDAENVDSGESVRLHDVADTLEGTNGTRSFGLSEANLLATDAFEAADFEAPTGGSRESTIRFDVEAIIERSDGSVLVETASDDATVTVEHADGPSIETFDLTDESNPQWDRVTVGWATTAGTGELESVRSELVGDDGTVHDEGSTEADGASASGEHALRSTDGGPYEIVLTATDEYGIEAIESKPFESDEAFDDGEAAFESLTAEVTDTRGPHDAPSEVTFNYELDVERTVLFTVDVDGDVESETATGTAGTVVVATGGGQPPNTSVATVAGDIDGGERCSTEITATDGRVDLC